MGKKNAGEKQANQARADEQERQARIRAGTEQVNQTFNQFDDNFFNKQRDNFTAFALPQLDQQYGKAQKDLTFALTRAGNLDSSTRGQQFGELQKLYDTNKTQVADQGQTYANQARTSVEDARAGLITTLNATGDATGAASGATARSAALAQPPGYSAIGDAFAAFRRGLATQAGIERSAAYTGTTPRYNTGLFGTTAGAVRNTP